MNFFLLFPDTTMCVVHCLNRLAKWVYTITITQAVTHISSPRALLSHYHFIIDKFRCRHRHFQTLAHQVSQFWIILCKLKTNTEKKSSSQLMKIWTRFRLDLRESLDISMFKIKRCDDHTAHIQQTQTFYESELLRKSF